MFRPNKKIRVFRVTGLNFFFGRGGGGGGGEKIIHKIIFFQNI